MFENINFFHYLIYRNLFICFHLLIYEPNQYYNNYLFFLLFNIINTIIIIIMVIKIYKGLILIANKNALLSIIHLHNHFIFLYNYALTQLEYEVELIVFGK